MSRNIYSLFVRVIFILAALGSAIVISASPKVQAAPTQAYVCTNTDPYWCDNRPGSLRYGPYSFENDYVATVLKNEWGVGSSYMQALYAGAVTIRTFAQRPADGCGAIAYYFNGVPVEHNISQRYFPNSGVLQAHRDAANQTAGTTILRFNDNGIACAKYFADAGDPTGSYYDEGSPTDTAVEDDVSISYGGHNPGVGQDGSIAWSLGSSSTRLNWPQILGKYYTRIGLSAGTNNTGILIPKNNYRWTWTDVANTYDYQGIVSQAWYHTPKTNTPTSMRPNCVYQVPFTVFNGSKVTFYSEGSANPTRLSYHWYNMSRQTVVWDGTRTYLGGDLGFGQQRLLQAQVRAPVTAGVYYLDWDLVQEGITWHEWKNATRQEVTVSVSGTACP